MSRQRKIISAELSRKLRDAMRGERNLQGADAIRILEALMNAHGWCRAEATRALGVSITCLLNWQQKPECILRPPVIQRLAAAVDGCDAAKSTPGIPAKHAAWLATHGFERHADGSWRRKSTPGVRLWNGGHEDIWELSLAIEPKVAICFQGGTPLAVWTRYVCFRPTVDEWLRER